MRRAFSQAVFLLVATLATVLLASAFQLNSPLRRIVPNSALMPAQAPLGVSASVHVDTGSAANASFLDAVQPTWLSLTKCDVLAAIEKAKTGVSQARADIGTAKAARDQSVAAVKSKGVLVPKIEELIAAHDLACDAYFEVHNSRLPAENTARLALTTARTSLNTYLLKLCLPASVTPTCVLVNRLRTDTVAVYTKYLAYANMANINVVSDLQRSAKSWTINGLWGGAGVPSLYKFASDVTTAAIEKHLPRAQTEWKSCSKSTGTFWRSEWVAHGATEGFGRPLFTYFEDALGLYAAKSALCSRAVAQAATRAVDPAKAKDSVTTTTTFDGRAVEITATGDCKAPVTFTRDKWVRAAASVNTSSITLHKCALSSSVNAAAALYDKYLFAETPVTVPQMQRDRAAWIKALVAADTAADAERWTIKSLIPKSGTTAAWKTDSLDVPLVQQHVSALSSATWPSCSASVTDASAWAAAWKTYGAPQFGHNSPGYFTEATDLLSKLSPFCTIALHALTTRLLKQGSSDSVKFAKAKSDSSYVYTPVFESKTGWVPGSVTVSTHGACTVHFSWTPSSWA